MRRIALLLLIAPLLGFAQSNDPVPAPEIKKDDRWTYRGTNVVIPGTHIYVTEVTHVSDKIIITVSTITEGKEIESIGQDVLAGKEIDSTWTTGWNPIKSYSGNMYVPHGGFFRYPLTVGDTYAVEFKVLGPKSTLCK